MATETTNYKLIKDGPNEYYDIEKLNANLDKIDEAIYSKVDKVAGKGLSANDYSNVEKQKVADNKSVIDTHTADDNLIKHKAKQIELQDTANLFASTNVEDGMSELFTNVSNGKDLVSGAITGVDDSVVIPTEPSFADLAGAIGGISTGKKWASGRVYTEKGEVETIVTDFKPRVVIVSMYTYYDLYSFLLMDDKSTFVGSRQCIARQSDNTFMIRPRSAYGVDILNNGFINYGFSDYVISRGYYWEAYE